jgi:hydrogenase/urease accessory protein HupE
MRLRPHSILFQLLALLLSLSFGSTVFGHALEPGYLELRQLDEGLYAVVWKKPAVEGAPMAISVNLPEQCSPRAEGQLSWDGGAFFARWTAKCTGGLEGGNLEIVGLENTSTDVLIRFEFSNGVSGTHRLTPTETSFIVPSEPDRMEVVKTYFAFGVEHILSGIDHLLFVLALLLLVKGTRRIVATVTAFTVAHSITLAGATLGLVHLPGPPIEATISLSIAFVAAEILHGRDGRPGMTERYPWVVAFTFGLLHGFGFAGALTQVGLPQTEIPMALLFFNVGVEAGQLLFIAAAFTVFWLARHATKRINLPQFTGAGALPAYVIGSLAIFWTIERTSAFFY